MREFVEVEVTVIRTTDKAMLVEIDDGDDEEIWIPFSCVEDNGEDFKRGFTGPIYVVEWFAEREGLA